MEKVPGVIVIRIQKIACMPLSRPGTVPVRLCNYNTKRNVA